MSVKTALVKPNAVQGRSGWQSIFCEYRVSLYFIAIFFCLFALYIKTACLDAYTGDNGELLTTVYRLGVPHPTGYPAFNIIGKVFSWLPMGGFPIRVAWFAGACSALAAAILFLISRRIIASNVISAWIAILFGLAPLLWESSISAEVYGFHMALVTTVILLLLRFVEKPGLQRAGIFAFFLSFSFLNHLQTSLVVIPLAVWVAINVPRRKWLLLLHPFVVIPFLANLGLYVYLPLRHDNTFIVQWGELSKAGMFFRHIIGKQFYTAMFSDLGEQYLTDNILKFFRLTGEQFPFFVVGLTLIGAVSLWLNKKKWFLFLFLIFFIDVVFAINYDIVDIDNYFLHAIMVMTIVAGQGIMQLIEWVRLTTKKFGVTVRADRAVLASAFLILLPAVIHSYYFCDRSNNFLAHDYAVNTLYTLEHKSVLLTQGWNSPFLLSYFQEVLHARPDVDVYIDNHGRLLQQFLTKYQVLGPVYSNIHMEVMATRGEKEEAFGLLYKIGQYPFYSQTPSTIWNYYRMRNLHSREVFYDYHSRALLSMYSYMKGEYEFLMDHEAEARKEFHEASQIARFNSFVHNNLACILFRLGWYDDAERECWLALDLNHDFPQVRYNLGNIFFMKGDYAAALKLWNQLDHTDYNVTSSRALGAIYLSQGKYTEALDALLKAKFAEPKSVEILSDLGITLRFLGHLEEAQNYFQEALQINPKYFQAYNNLGSLYLDKGDSDQAAEHFKKALEINPAYSDARINLGIVLAQKEQWAEAENQFQQVAAKDPKNTKALNNLGLLYTKTNRLGQAREMWEKSVALDPTQSNIAAALAEIQSVTGGTPATESGNAPSLPD